MCAATWLSLDASANDCAFPGDLEIRQQSPVGSIDASDDGFPRNAFVDHPTRVRRFAEIRNPSKPSPTDAPPTERDSIIVPRVLSRPRKTRFSSKDRGRGGLSRDIGSDFGGELGRSPVRHGRCPAMTSTFDLPGAGVLNEDGRHAGGGRLRRSSTVICFTSWTRRGSRLGPAGLAIGPRNAPAIL